MQAVDFRDDHCLGVLPLRRVGRQGAGCLLGMPQPHGDVKPVEARRLGDAGLDQDRAQPGTAIGEGSQLGISCLADIDKAALDQYLDRGVGSSDGGEDLPAAVRRLDIAEEDFEMPLVLLAAPNEGRVQGQGDRRGCGRRVGRGGVDQGRADLERAGVSGSLPASIGRRYSSTPAATR